MAFYKDYLSLNAMLEAIKMKLNHLNLTVTDVPEIHALRTRRIGLRFPPTTTLLKGVPQ